MFLRGSWNELIVRVKKMVLGTRKRKRQRETKNKTSNIGKFNCQ
jgi:hypothetical protein